MRRRCSSCSASVLAIFLAAQLIVWEGVLGLRCACTSKACKESGVKTCRTRFSCYTELIYDGDANVPGTRIKTTRGCTENATPLLCETKSWGSSDEEKKLFELAGQAVWPRLTCCDDQDNCNAAANEDPAGEPSELDRPLSPTARQASLPTRWPSDRLTSGRERATDAAGTVHNSAQKLHLAALVLAVAALISVFAACYVVTRFLKNGRTDAANADGSAVQMMIGPYNDRLDF